MRKPAPALTTGARSFGSCLVLVVLTLASCVAEPQRPDIVLITLDTLRADALGPYRGGASLTPRIDRFAASAVIFENAMTPIGTTFPAHASLFTGLYPRVHGVRWNGDRLDASHRTVAERLADSGYSTAAFVAVPTMLNRGGLGQGFEFTISAEGSDAFEIPGTEVNRQAREWIESAGDDRPMFLWAHYFEAHTPYRAGPYAREQFRRLRYSGPLLEGASVETFYSLGKDHALSDLEREAVRVLYDEEAVRLDQYVGELLDALDRRQSGRPLFVVLTADHGQSLGEHGAFGHGFLLWQPVLHVPLLVGGDLVEGAERRVPTRVSLVDLQPTLLEVAGVEVPSGTAGRSLWPALVGRRLGERTLFAEVRTLAADRPRQSRDESAVAVFDGSSKLVWDATGTQIFDLAVDPSEQAGRAAVSNDRERFLQQLAEAYSHSVTTIEDWQRIDTETLEELRSLGYVD